MDHDHDLGRVIAFLRAFALRRARRVVEVPAGFVVLDDRYPASYDHNKLIVTGTPEPVEIVATADERLAAAGLRHRMVVVEDDRHGRACAATLAAAGYQHATDLVMRYPHSASPDAAPAQAGGSGAVVERVAPGDLYDSDARRWRRILPDADAETIRHLVERRATLPDGADQVGFLAVRDRTGGVASCADLYLEPAAGIAQIEDLATDPAHSRRGYAGLIVADALRTARSAGCDLVFLVADGDDWPQRWYGRLGFTAIGAFHVFTRPITG